MNLLYDLPCDIKLLILDLCFNNYPSAYYILTGYFPSFRIGDKKIFRSQSIIEDAIKYDNISLIELLVVSDICYNPSWISLYSAKWGSFTHIKMVHNKMDIQCINLLHQMLHLMVILRY